MKLYTFIQDTKSMAECENKAAIRTQTIEANQDATVKQPELPKQEKNEPKVKSRKKKEEEAV
jgi:hypothetical protein